MSQFSLGKDGRPTFKRNSIYAPQLGRIALQRLSSIFLHAVSSLLSQFPLGDRRAPHIQAQLNFCITAAETCFATPLLDLLTCCQFSSVSISARCGRAPHIQAQLNFCITAGENRFATPLLDLSVCCHVFSVSISARGGRAPDIQAQLNVFAPHLWRIALQRLS